MLDRNGKSPWMNLVTIPKLLQPQKGDPDTWCASSCSALRIIFNTSEGISKNKSYQSRREAIENSAVFYIWKTECIGVL